MTHLPATFVRTALLFLITGFVLGAWMMAAPAFGLSVPAGMRVMHIHFLTAGFVTCMVMGVALWMFPSPLGTGRAGIAVREPWGWAAYGLMTGGLLLRAVTAFVPMAYPDPVRWALLISAAAQVLAAVCFATAIWARTQPRTFIRNPAPGPSNPAQPNKNM